MLTIRQPWAWAIVAGFKIIENRSWRTHYRGPLAIVASKSRETIDEGEAFLRALGIEPPRAYSFGALLGAVELTDLQTLADFRRQPNGDDPFAVWPFCWILRSPVRLDRPVACTGAQKLVELPRKYHSHFSQSEHTRSSR